MDHGQWFDYNLKCRPRRRLLSLSGPVVCPSVSDAYLLQCHHHTLHDAVETAVERSTDLAPHLQKYSCKISWALC